MPTVAALARNGRRTLIVAGYAAEVVVLRAVLDAIVAGYRALRRGFHRQQVRAKRRGPHFGRWSKLGHFLLRVRPAARLTPDFFHPPGTETIAALQTLLRH
ncbi:hypothetical protein V1281_006677 [Nitrobacteraceae bacterium AZCC 2161]